MNVNINIYMIIHYIYKYIGIGPIGYIYMYMYINNIFIYLQLWNSAGCTIWHFDFLSKVTCHISRCVLSESLDDGVDSRRHSLGLEVEVVLDGRVALWHAGLLERLER